MKIIRSVEEAQTVELQLGEAYIIDPGLPEAPEDLTPELLAEFDAIGEAVNARFRDTPVEDDIQEDDEDDVKTPPGQDKKTIAATHTIAALRKMATEYKIAGRSKMGESELIDALVSAGAFTS